MISAAIFLPFLAILKRWNGLARGPKQLVSMSLNLQAGRRFANGVVPPLELLGLL
jgi:hypothetical protein